MSKLSSNEIRRRVFAVLLCAIVAAAASFAAPLSALAEDEAAAPAAADELAGGGGALPEGMPGEAAVPAAAPGEYAVPAATEDADGETDASSDAAYFRALAAGDVQGAWEETPGGWVYLDPAGAPYTGWKSVDGEARYFDPANGGVAPQGWFNHANGQTYYFWWSGKGTFASGLSDIGGRSYYFNGQGHLEAGWQSVDGQARYFDPAQGGAAPQGWFDHSNGHTYYFWWSGQGT
ncbi:MAG: hypothetical protein LBS91_04750, partial [Clostridiales Family XIII bacterium]|nr:hypothetical protein [Clostridiales Family XIII bacterium]